MIIIVDPFSFFFEIFFLKMAKLTPLKRINLINWRLGSELCFSIFPRNKMSNLVDIKMEIMLFTTKKTDIT